MKHYWRRNIVDLRSRFPIKEAEGSCIQKRKERIRDTRRRKKMKKKNKKGSKSFPRTTTSHALIIEVRCDPGPPPVLFFNPLCLSLDFSL